MKKAVLMLFVVGCVMFFSGCVIQSVYPFCSAEDVIDINELHGSWELIKSFDENTEAKQIAPWEIGANKIICYDERNIKSPFDVKFFKVGDSVFADISAGDLMSGAEKPAYNTYWAFCVIPIHTVAKFAISGDDLVITPASYKAVEEKISSGKIKLAHLIRKEDGLLLTADTMELKKFLLEFKEDAEIFPSKNSFILKRKNKKNTGDK
jgi:hypothetical protein